LGIGFFHGTMHSPDPLPEQFGGESFFRDFGSPMPELGIALSHKLKLSLRAYYHHREYTYKDNSNYNDYIMQHMGQYLDIPVSLSAKVLNWDIYAGPNLGFLLYDGVFDDITDNPEAYEDAKSFVAGVHAGIKIPFPGTKNLAILTFYSKDLMPFSELWQRKMFQDRYVVQLMYRFMNEQTTQSLAPGNTLDDLVHSYIPDLNLGVGFGVSRAKILAQPNLQLVEDFDYRSSHYNSGLELGWRALPQLEIHTYPHLHWREYNVTEQPYGRKFFNSQSQYLDLPLMLKTCLGGIEVSAGVNLAFETNTKYNSNFSITPESGLQDANPFIPGISAGFGFPLGKLHRTSLDLLYTKDGQPYSRAYGFSKTQENIAIFLSYRLVNTGTMADLMPADTMTKDGVDYSMEIGYKRVTISEYDFSIIKYDVPMPFSRRGLIKRGESGFGLGYLVGSGLTAFKTGKYTKLFLGRLTLQKRISYALSIFELYAAPGLGIDIGIATDSYDGMMDEGFPFLPYANLMFAWEAGLRLNLYKTLSLIGFAEKQNTIFYNSPVRFGISAELGI
jgi:hypothetical protein